jgi:hypothetical protein
VFLLGDLQLQFQGYAFQTLAEKIGAGAVDRLVRVSHDVMLARGDLPSDRALAPVDVEVNVVVVAELLTLNNVGPMDFAELSELFTHVIVQADLDLAPAFADHLRHVGLITLVAAVLGLVYFEVEDTELIAARDVLDLLAEELEFSARGVKVGEVLLDGLGVYNEEVVVTGLGVG